MTFLEKIKPHLISGDILIQETVLHALHDYPNVPEEWINELLKEAFRKKDKQSSILIYVENQPIAEEGVRILIENIPLMDPSKRHLAIDLVQRIEPETAFKYKEQLQKYVPQDTWSLYDLLLHGTEEEVYMEYGQILNDLDCLDSFQHDLYIKAKKLAACLVKKGWVSEEEIQLVLQEEVKEQWFSFNGILTVYMIGLLKLEKYIPILADLLVRDDDTLLEEASEALIRFQSDEAVKDVAPYLRKDKSIIYAASIVENIKSDLAVKVLREAYHSAKELDQQDILAEALSHQLSEEALPEINEHMKLEYSSGLVDIEQPVYSYYSILGLDHPELDEWRQVAMEREIDFRNSTRKGNALPSAPIRNENKVGRNDPCPCGSGKKYKKCCGSEF
ncbi:SEC-C motif domain-containing protein [Neobacillus bataviensis LMG 21833]|uniref:SEC-C motif domain-containing protein n=1 Tax=Neobacillus bataviensis LMG 21833 TaxID=1117379 RepID=K6DFS0_9BACI|nr:SEC-C metal-binding domain-containing protein [Neobacillus bataviensis]EKN66928.1 SEC-C motif domain-containing protein [Neobacillus bataviensis LMG 21833]